MLWALTSQLERFQWQKLVDWNWTFSMSMVCT